MLPKEHSHKPNAVLTALTLQTRTKRRYVAMMVWRADATFNRYDPWYVKVTFGLFVTLVVGLLAVLHGAPNYLVQ